MVQYAKIQKLYVVLLFNSGAFFKSLITFETFSWAYSHSGWLFRLGEFERFESTRLSPPPLPIPSTTSNDVMDAVIKEASDRRMSEILSPGNAIFGGICYSFGQTRTTETLLYTEPTV